ncbi:MAG: hypothetical protein IV100_29165, partial [Myxococcales bacterium]|nr:hypothetical protein [Myxococcales bacterium]
MGGLLLIGGIVACVVVAREKKQKSEELEPATKLSTYEPAAEASSLRRDDNAAKRASTY